MIIAKLELQDIAIIIHGIAINMNIRFPPALPLLVLITAFLLSACAMIDDQPEAVQEPATTETKQPRIKKTTVYFYRPDQSISGWTWKQIEIMEIHALGLVTDPEEKSQVTRIGILKNHSYIKTTFTPGAHRFSANWKLRPYEFTLKPGEDLCIKAEIDLVDALQQRATLVKVDQDTCESDIKDAEEIVIGQ